MVLGELDDGARRRAEAPAPAEAGSTRISAGIAAPRWRTCTLADSRGRGGDSQRRSRIVSSVRSAAARVPDADLGRRRVDRGDVEPVAGGEVAQVAVLAEREAMDAVVGGRTIVGAGADDRIRAVPGGRDRTSDGEVGPDFGWRNGCS